MLPKNSSKGFASVVRYTDAPQDQMTSAIAAICKSSFGPRNQVCSQDVIVFSSQVYDTSLTDKDRIGSGQFPNCEFPYYLQVPGVGASMWSCGHGKFVKQLMSCAKKLTYRLTAFVLSDVTNCSLQGEIVVLFP